MGNLQRPQASLTAKNFPPCAARVKNLSFPLYFPDTTYPAVGSGFRLLTLILLQKSVELIIGSRKRMKHTVYEMRRTSPKQWLVGLRVGLDGEL